VALVNQLMSVIDPFSDEAFHGWRVQYGRPDAFESWRECRSRSDARLAAVEAAHYADPGA